MSYQDSVWIGAKNRDPENELYRVLVMGHSTYGTRSDDRPGIRAWIGGEVDITFSIFYGHLTGLEAAKASRAQRQEFFDRIAYINFVDHILGEEDRDPTKDEYEQAALDLPARIEQADPIAVFVFGKKHQGYSLRVLDKTKLRNRYRAAVHPVQDNQRRFLPAWREFVQMLPQWRKSS